MEKFVLRQPLPSCRVGRDLLAEVETFLLEQIPLLLKSDLDSMRSFLDLKGEEPLHDYVLAVEDRSGVRRFAGTAELEGALPPSTRKVALRLKLGRPELVAVSVCFSRAERPYLEVATIRQPLRDLCHSLAAEIRELIGRSANPHRIVHRPWAPIVPAVALPAAFIGCGLWAGIDSFVLAVSAGWLVLLCALPGWILPRALPYVTFHTTRRFSFRQCVLLAALALNLAAICGYVGLLMVELGRFRRL